MGKRAREAVFDEEFLRRLQGLHLIAKRMAASGAAGARRSRRLGDGLEFADHRAYTPGDDVRFIDWPYYARMERLLLRLFHEHSEAGVAILLDASASMAPGGLARGPSAAAEKFHYALRAAAALAYVAMGSFERVLLLPFAEDLAEPLRAGRSRGQIFEVLDFLAGLAPGGPTRLGRCVEQFVARHSQGGTALLLSDLLDAEADLSDALARLGLGGWETSVVHLYSASDAAPELAGPMLLAHAERPERMAVNVTDALRTSFRRRWRQFQAGCERTCLSRGAVYVSAPTTLAFERLVLHTLRRAGVLAG